MKIISNNPVINRILEYVKIKYHAQIDCPWYKYSDFFVIRGRNRKWFGLIMKIPYQKLHINKEGMVDIINVKIDDQGLYDTIVDNKTIFPGYHMSKHKWISILLDKSIKNKEILQLIDESYIAVFKK